MRAKWISRMVMRALPLTIAATAAACGTPSGSVEIAEESQESSNSTDTTDDVDVEPRDTDQSKAGADETETAAPEAADGSADVVLSDATPLSAALTQKREADGWSVKPGEWSTASLGLAFELSEPALLISESVGTTTLAPLDADGEVTLFEVLSFVETDASGATTEVPGSTDPMDFMTGFQPLTVVESGTVDGPLGLSDWWDLAVDPGITSSVACGATQPCLDIAQVTQFAATISLLPDQPSRLFDLPTGDRHLMALATGDAIELAEAIVRTLAYGPETARDTAGPRFLRTVDTTSPPIPPGQYIHPLNDAIVTLNLDRLDDAVTDPILAIAGQRSAVLMDGQGGVLNLIGTDRFVAPDGVQALSCCDLATDPPTDVAGFESWLSSMITVTDSGSTVVAGQDATWFDTTVTEDNRSSACGPQRTPEGEGECVNMLVADTIHMAASIWDRRYYYLHDTGIVVEVSEPGAVRWAELLLEAVEIED